MYITKKMNEPIAISQSETMEWASNIILPVHQITTLHIIKGIKAILTLDEAREEANRNHEHSGNTESTLQHKWPEYKKNDHWLWLIWWTKSCEYKENESWILVPEKWLIKK